MAIGQALENIIRNALRYTPPSGKILVQSSNNDNEIFIDVIDSGPGVPSSMTRAIFEPFFRVEQSRMVDSNSFGLGLALAKRQIETVGGEISASNRSPNGLKVTIRLPIQA